MIEKSAKYLSKGSFADKRIDFVSVEETLAVADDIVVIVVIISVIVEFALLLVLRILTLRLLRSAFLLCIINLTNRKHCEGVNIASKDTIEGVKSPR